MEKRFTHLDPDGNPTMVDVSDKDITKRTAKAIAIVYLNEAILARFEGNELHTKKGPVFQTAIVAGIMASKKTSELIPLCHPLPLDSCRVTIDLNEKREVEIIATATTTAKTGVEMEALTAATVAALTIYDMCKGFSHDITISTVRLIEKTGGKSDVFFY